MITKIYIVPTDTCMGIGCRLDDRAGYEMLFDFKGRNRAKPLSILLPTWEDLAYETTLSASQINFLKTYKFPFTIITDVREDFRDEYPLLREYNYTSVGFRVGEACLSDETLSYVRNPLFLTSANLSGEPECHTYEAIEAIWGKDVGVFKRLPGKSGHQPASNVILFKQQSNDLQYLRKNYPRPLRS